MVGLLAGAVKILIKGEMSNKYLTCNAKGKFLAVVRICFIYYCFILYQHLRNYNLIVMSIMNKYFYIFSPPDHIMAYF